jgi:hypothetical protein
MKQIGSFLCAALWFAGSAFHPNTALGQGAPSRATTQAPAKARAATPVTMTECEGVNNCATWTFLGAQGNGQWPSGEVANLSVERYDDNSVVIRRADSTGSSAGLTAVYTGTRHGDRVGGDFTSSWPGHWDNKAGNWYATVEAAISRPTVMHFCAANCFTLTWDGGRYVNSTGFDWNPDFRSIWTVDVFTRESVVLRRTDTGKFPLTAVYRGQISKEGNRLVNATWNGDHSDFKLAWGTALNTVPGSNEERDRGKPAQQQVVVVRPGPVVCFPWFFGVVCE